MGQLSISTAWTETGQFLAREARLVVPIALLLLMLPPAAEQLLLAPPETQMSLGRALLGLAVTLVVVVTGLVAGIAITHLTLAPGASVGEAMARGWSRCLSLLGSSFLIALPLVLIAFVLIAAMTPGLATARQPFDPNNMPPGFAAVVMILSILAVAFWVKISLGTPVAAAEKAGPVGIIRRSWTLTTGHYWKLLGTFLLLLLVSSLIVLALSSGIGVLVLLAAGPPAFGNASFIATTLIASLLQTMLTTVLIVLVARIYAQLAETRPA